MPDTPAIATLDELREALTPKQFLFVEKYLGVARFNGTKAARLAGYEGDDNVLAVTAHENLKNPKISAYISQRLSDAKMSADKVLALLTDQAEASLEDFLDLPDPDPDMRRAFPKAYQHLVTIDLLKAQERGKMHLVKKVKTDGVGGIEIELHDPQAALVQLGRHHGLFKDKVEQTGEGLDVLRQFLGVGDSAKGMEGDAEGGEADGGQELTDGDRKEP